MPVLFQPKLLRRGYLKRVQENNSYSTGMDSFEISSTNFCSDMQDSLLPVTQVPQKINHFLDCYSSIVQAR